MEVRRPAICRQCKKDIITNVVKCVPCEKLFHPSCIKLHKIYNKDNELEQCKGKTETFVLASGSSRERKTSDADAEGSRTTCSSMDSKIDAIYKMIREIKNEMVGKDLIRQVITEVVDEEMEKVRHEIRMWKEAELKPMINRIVKEEGKKLVNLLPTAGTSTQDTGKKKKSYSDAVSNKQEAVVIIKPLKEDDANSSEETKRDIKEKIDVTKLGLGITKMKKVTKGAVVVGCESNEQAEILKERVTSDLGEKYVIKAPKKKKRKIKIFGADKEDCEDEKDFWRKIEEQNGFTKNSVQGKIVHKSQNEKSQRATIIAEVDDKTYETLLEEEKVKIGWNICKVQDYIGILRCFKCCGYYHFAKDCKKEVACGKCAGKHATNECRSDIRKCVNCEEKIKSFKLKNINSEHAAFDTNCPYYKRELEKQKNKIISSL